MNQNYILYNLSAVKNPFIVEKFSTSKYRKHRHRTRKCWTDINNVKIFGTHIHYYLKMAWLGNMMNKVNGKIICLRSQLFIFICLEYWVSRNKNQYWIELSTNIIFKFEILLLRSWLYCKRRKNVINFR